MENNTNRKESTAVALLATVMTIACILWNVDAPTRLGVAILPQQYMAFQLGLTLAICYLKFGWSGEAKKNGIGVLDAVLAAAAFLVLMYAAWNYA